MTTNNYILTSNGGGFLSETELYHHGVKGMKWGVRKTYDKYLQRKRRVKKSNYIFDQINNTIQPDASSGNKLNKIKSSSRNYKRSDTKLAWKQAKNKAKMDSSYKNSDEYRKAKQENAKVATMEALEQLMNSTIRN